MAIKSKIPNKSIFDYRRSEDINNNQKSLIRTNREYMISRTVARELNSYLISSVFPTIDDKFLRDENSVALTETSEESKAKRETANSAKLLSPRGVRSIFNRHAAVSLAKGKDAFNMTEWRLANNVPLMDTRDSREIIKSASDCSVKNLVRASQNGLLGREYYSYSDFMFCKYLGKVSNNYMVTLRRFPFPVDDFISLIGVSGELLMNKKLENGNATPIGCLVTWIGTPGNDMSNILKWTVKMPFKELTLKWETVSGGDASDGVKSGALLNNIAAAADPTYMRQATAGMAPIPFNNFFKGITGGRIGDNPYSVSSLSSQVDNNKTYGPVDAIKKTYVRDGDAGIEFDLNITLTFDYELRAYNGINTRQAMLDLLANILAVTYITGPWWKGGYRGGGAHQNNIFSHLKIFQCRGGFNDFVDAFAEDYSTVTEGFRNKLKEAGGDNWMQQAMNLMKSALNTMGGMILGGMLNSLGRPAKGFANSLLSGAPVGFWHVTIGNPFHPIMSMGNMILKNTTVEHYGPLGLDDFPTGLRVTCELQRGKSRDLRSIEELYMHGNDRIYTGLSNQVIKVFEKAEEYNSADTINKSKLITEQNRIILALGANAADIDNIEIAKPDDMEDKAGLVSDYLQLFKKLGYEATEEGLVKLKDILKKYYGTDDAFSIFTSAMEAEYGAQKPSEAKDKENGLGDTGSTKGTTAPPANKKTANGNTAKK